MTPVFQRPQAELDTLDLGEFIANDDPEAGDRFFAAVEKSYDLLARFPDLGTPWRPRRRKYLGLRWSPVQGFPNHLIFYVHRNQVVDVIRLVHGAQDLRALFG